MPLRRAGREGIAAAILVALLGLLAGCLGFAPTPTSIPTATVEPAPTTTAQGAPAQITYEVTGGIAGMRDVLEIRPGGDMRLTKRGSQVITGTLGQEEYQSLIELFDAAGFFDLQERYDEGNVSDDIYLAITYSRDGRAKTVTVAQVGGQGLTPPALQDLLNELDQIYRERF